MCVTRYEIFKFYDFRVRRVRSGFGTIIPDPTWPKSSGSGSTPLPWPPPLSYSALPVADDRHQAEIRQLLILVERPVLPLQAVLRIRDVYPGSRLPDPKTATKERGEKKLVFIPFYVATNFTKL
jgi:hypothetical protein